VAVELAQQSSPNCVRVVSAEMPAHAHDLRLPTFSTVSARTDLLFLPDCKGFGEGAVPRQTLFYGQDGSAAIAVGDWDVEPGAFLEHLNITLLIRIGGRKLDYKNTIHRPGSNISERSTRLLLRSFHQYSRHAGHAATRKICREIKHHFDGVTGRQSVVDVSPKQPSHGDPSVGNFHVGAYSNVGLCAGDAVSVRHETKPK